MIMSKIYLSSFLRVESYYAESRRKQVKRVWAVVSAIYGQLTRNSHLEKIFIHERASSFRRGSQS